MKRPRTSIPSRNISRKGINDFLTNAFKEEPQTIEKDICLPYTEDQKIWVWFDECVQSDNTPNGTNSRSIPKDLFSKLEEAGNDFQFYRGVKFIRLTQKYGSPTLWGYVQPLFEEQQ